MSSDQSMASRQIRIGSERALVVEDHAATVLFGIGPATGAGADPGRVANLVSALAPAAEAARWARQVHGSELEIVPEWPPDPIGCVGPADAMATSEQGIALLVWTADCVPVMMVGPGVVAAVHAGWRGCAAGIARRAVETLETRFAAPSHRLSVYLGPAISAARYEVGPEVIDSLHGSGADPSAWHRGGHVDLRKFLTAELHNLGVTRVRSVGPCTFSSPQYASFRRDGAAAGRQWSLVYRSKNDDVEPS